VFKVRLERELGTQKRCHAPTATFYRATSGTSLINTAARSNRSSRSTASLSSSRVKTKKGELLTSGIIGTRDRRRYLHWVFKAKKRFGLSALNYVVTSTTFIFCSKTPAPEEGKRCEERFPLVSRDARRDFKPLMASVWGAAIVWRGL